MVVVRAKTFRIVEESGKWTFHDPDGPAQIFVARDDVLRTALQRADVAAARGERIRVTVQHDTGTAPETLIAPL